MTDINSAELTSDLDIFRTARMLINEHGEQASIEAAMRADELLAAGDLDGQAVWLRVLRAVKELLQQKPERGQAIH